MNCATRLTFEKHLVQDCTVSSMGAFWDNSPPRLGSICFMSRSILQRFLRLWQSDKSGIVEHECFVSLMLHPSEGAPWQGHFPAAGTWRAFPKEVLCVPWLCAQEEHPLGWLRSGYVPGLVLLTAKT